MKVRIYSPFFPYPASEGAFVVIAGQIEGFLKAGHSVELVFWKGGSDLSKTPSRIRQALNSTDSPGLTIINWSRTSGRKDSFWAKGLRILSSLLSTESSTGLFYYPSESDFRVGLEACDLAIYHHCYSYSWLVRRLPSEKRQVVHFHNIESDLMRQLADRSSGLSRWLHLKNAAKVEVREGRLRDLADEIWTVSPTDYRDFSLLHSSASRSQLKYKAPNYSSVLFDRRKQDFLKEASLSRTQILFIGGLSFHPNHDSLMWLLTEVAPLLRAGGFQGELQVIGGGASDELRARASEFSFVRLLGFIPDLEEHLKRVSLLLVPDLGGSGVRIKLLEGLASGIPVLANASAVERIHPELLSSPFLIRREQASDWAQFILGLRGVDLRRELSVHAMDRALSFDYLYQEFLF